MLTHQRQLRPGERLTIYQLTPGQQKLIKPLYDRCRPKRGTEADPLTKNPKLIEGAYQERFVQPLDDALASLRKTEHSDTSPLLDALHALAQEGPLADAAGQRVLEIWSDMLAKSKVVDQYRPGYSFEQLKRSNSLYLEVPALRGAQVRIFELSDRYPRYQNAEHARFWAQYFADVGAVAPVVRRL